MSSFRKPGTNLGPWVLAAWLLRVSSRQELPTDEPGTQLRTLTPDHVRFVGRERAEVDLAIGALPDVPSGCEVEDLLEDPMVVIAAEDHPRIKSRLSVEAYAKLPHAELGSFDCPFVLL